MFKPSLVAAAVAACSSFAVYAETVLPTTIVTASRLSSLPAGTPLYTIDQEDIQKSSAQTIADLLTTMPSISVRQLASGFNEATIDLRGFGAAASTNTLILLNGRRLNDIDLSSADLSGIPIANIDHIEVLAGGGSVLYGDGASGGTINIITKQATHNSASIAVATGSFDSKDIQANSEIVSDKAAIRLFARHAESDGYRANSASRQDIFGLDGEVTHDQQTWFLSGQSSQSDNRLAGVRKINPTLNINEFESDPKGTASPNDYAEDNKYQLWGGVKIALNKQLELIIDGSKRYKTQHSFYGDYDFGGAYNSYINTRLMTDAITPRLVANYRVGSIDNTLRTGIDWYKTDYLSYRGKESTVAPNHTITIDSESQSLYLLQSSRIEKTTLTIGARKTNIKQQGEDLLDSSAPNGAFDSQAPAAEQTYREDMYEAGINQGLGFGLTAMFSASRSVRFGTVDEVYEYDTNFMRVFSPLLPQVGKNIEASLAYDNDIANVTATIYRQKLENEIHFNPQSFTNDNLDPTKRSGITLATTVHLPMNVQFNGSLTQQKAEFTEGQFAGNDIPVVAKNLASLGLFWQPISSLNIGLTDTYTGSKHLDNDQTNDFYTKIPAYHRLDAKTSYRLAHWQASLSVLNIANAKTHYDYGIRSTAVGAKNYNVYPLANREYRLALSYDF